MAILDKDFIHSPKAKVVGANHAIGSFIGFKDELFFIPDKIDEYGHRADTIHSYSYEGKLPSEVVADLANNKEMPIETMKSILKEMLPSDFQYCFQLSNYRRFKISISFFSFLRTITILPMGVIIPFQVSIKDKEFLEKAKEFYKGMEK